MAMANMDEYLRDILECRIPELRAQLKTLESGKVREILADGADVTQAQIVWLERWISDYEAIAAKLRDDRT
jgi:hypothetical protein